MYHFCLRLFRRGLFFFGYGYGCKTETELNHDIWEVSSDTMRIGSDLTDKTSDSVWTRETEVP